MSHQAHSESYEEYLRRMIEQALADPRPPLSSTEAEAYMDGIKARQLVLLEQAMRAKWAAICAPAIQRRSRQPFPQPPNDEGCPGGTVCGRQSTTAELPGLTSVLATSSPRSMHDVGPSRRQGRGLSHPEPMSPYYPC